ncbi:unnamed protein product, partial [Meganyctiphanes norvegica]
MLESRHQVLTDMYNMKNELVKVIENKEMLDLFKELLAVENKGRGKIQEVIKEKNPTKLEEEAKKMDDQIYLEIMYRFSDGNMSVALSGARRTANIREEDILKQGEVSKVMFSIMLEFISVLQKGLADLGADKWKLFKDWWDLENKIEETKEKSLTMYDSK